MQKSISTFQAQGPHIIGASAALFPTPEDHEFLGIGTGRAHPSDDMRSGVVESRVLYIPLQSEVQTSLLTSLIQSSSLPCFIKPLVETNKESLGEEAHQVPHILNIQPLQIQKKLSEP